MKFAWNFGDKSGSTDPSPTHIYLKEGNYTVTLWVSDNSGESSQVSTYALITKKPNYPPTKPELTVTNINKEYILSLQATDPDNDTIQFIINWNDNTTTTDFVTNTTTVTHNYTSPGVYKIEAYANDINNEISETVELTILVDIHYLYKIGYLIDDTDDGNYDKFHSNATGNTTIVQQNDNIYLIDTNGDGTIDKQYNILTGDLGTYIAPKQASSQPETSIIITVVAFIIALLLTVTFIVIIRRRKELPHIATPKPDQLFYLKEIDTSEITDEESREIHKKIDDMILKYEQKNK